MIQTSETYQRLRSKNARTEVCLVIGFGPPLATEDGTPLLFGDTVVYSGFGPEDGLTQDAINKLDVTQRVISDSGVTPGQAMAGELTAELWKTDLDIPRQAQLRPYVRLTDGAETSEWIPQGVFFVDSRETDSPDGLEKLTLHGYDAMLRGEQSYPDSRLQWPAEEREVLREVAETMGVGVDARTYETMDKRYSVQLPSEYSCREVLADIAGMYGGSFAMSALGELLLVPLWGLDGETTVGSDILGDSSNAEPVTWDRVELDLDDDSMVSAGLENGKSLRISCRNGTEKMAQDLLEKIKNAAYRPFRAQTTLLDPAAELGDRVVFSGYTGVLLQAVRHLSTMYTADLECPGEEETDHEYPFVSQTERRENRRYKALRAALNVLSDRIEAVVEGGDGKSFGWTLESTQWTIKANGEPVLVANKGGLEISGTIKALKGLIGDFEIAEGAIRYGITGFDPSSKAEGVYLGPEGLQLGSFSVDAAGNVVAGSGTFSGPVYASNIEYGGEAGFLDGGALDDRTVGNFKIDQNCLSTYETDDGVNASLANADFAAAQFEPDSSGGYQIVAGGRRFVGTYMSRFRTGYYLFSQDS